MKNLALFALLLSSFVCTSVTAQIDSTFQVGYPYTKKSVNFGYNSGVIINAVHITSEDGTQAAYCEVTTTAYSPSSRGSLPTRSNESYSAFLSKAECKALAHDWSLTAGTSERMERVDYLKAKVGSIEMSIRPKGREAEYTLSLDADGFLDRGATDIKQGDVLVLVEALEECLLTL
jgi:hypothetical protein